MGDPSLARLPSTVTISPTFIEFRVHDDWRTACGRRDQTLAGNSRGRWEGNTLVVDVTNGNGLTWLDNAGNFYSDGLHVVERLTLIDRDTIHYEARLEDPQVYTRPWTMVTALTRNKEPGLEIWEQACHEGNKSVEDQLRLGLKRYSGATPPR